jgi:hypothetical protein
VLAPAKVWSRNPNTWLAAFAGMTLTDRLLVDPYQSRFFGEATALPYNSLFWIKYDVKDDD